MSLKDLRDRLERGISISPPLSAEILNRLVPVVVLEDLLGFDESAQFEVRFCSKEIGATAPAANFASDGVFNPIRSGVIGIITGFGFNSTVAAQILRLGIVDTAVAAAGPAAEFRDARMVGAPVHIPQQQVTTVRIPDRRLYGAVGSIAQDRSRQNPVAIIGPGQGWLMACQNSDSTINGFVEWTEILRKQAPGP